MNVFVANEQEFPVNEGRAIALARHTLGSEGVDDEAELSILYVSKEHIRTLNMRFAKNDYATDVLAFPMRDDDADDEEEGTLLGDVVICPAIAEEHAVRLGHGLVKELDTLLVHGTLHLLGYDHQRVDDKERMDRRLSEVLGSFKVDAL